MNISLQLKDTMKISTRSKWLRRDRQAVVFNTIEQCDKCNIKDTEVLYIDTSDTEYWEICLCKQCLLSFFSNDEHLTN